MSAMIQNLKSLNDLVDLAPTLDHATAHKGLLTRSDFKPYLPLDCIHLVAYYLNNDKIIYVSIHEDLNTKQSTRLFRKTDLIKFYR